MDLKDRLKDLGERVVKLKEQIQTEEATKNAFIMPFITSLGYDVFNPLEVVPEFVADIGIKKGEKVDYAIFKDDKPIILIECKHWREKLDIHNGQLLRYFHVSNAKFAILTNGIQFKFYTDLVEPNKMDEKPFLDFDITDVKEQQVEELKKFHKSYFDIDAIYSSASELKYTSEIKQIFANELKNPSEEFVRLFVSKIYAGRITANVLSSFTDLVKKSVNQVISDIITDRFKSAIDKEESQQVISEPEIVETEVSENENKIVTTEEEMEAFLIVKTICRQKIAVNRVFHRDTQSYFNILLDDNKLKLICRFYLNNPKKKYIAFLDEQKKEVSYEIKSLDDIYSYADNILSILDRFI